MVLALEVKAARAARPDDARCITLLRDRLDCVGNDFCVGVVLHTGPHRARLGDRIIALPIADLWT